MNSLQQRSEKKSVNIVNLLIVIYFTITTFDLLTTYYIDSVILLLVNTLILMAMIRCNHFLLDKKMAIITLLLFMNLGLIVISMIINEVSLDLFISRFLRIFVYMQFFFCLSINNNIVNYDFVVKNVVKVYYYLGYIILCDSISYILLNRSLWPPEDYVGLRFSGPFVDPNYLGIFYGTMFLIVLLEKNIVKESRRKLIIFVMLIICLISLSWSVIILIAVTLLIHQFIRMKSFFLKNIIIIISYITVLMIIKENIEIFRDIFYFLLNDVANFSEYSTSLKYISLEKRIMTQVGVIQLFTENIWGVGPKKVIEIFGMDTHNSYISFLGEMGIQGILAYSMVLLIKKNNYNKLIDVLTTFLLLEALFINVHLTPIFWLSVFILVWKYKEERSINSKQQDL